MIPDYSKISQDISDEVDRQNQKFGLDRNAEIPSLPGLCYSAGMRTAIGGHSLPPQLIDGKVSDHFLLPLESFARMRCDDDMEVGDISYTGLVLEEFCEAVYAKTTANRRAELVQLGALVMQWIYMIDSGNEGVI